MRREALGFEKVAHVVVREPVQVVSQVRAGVIHLAAYQKMLVKLRGYPYGFPFQITLFV